MSLRTETDLVSTQADQDYANELKTQLHACLAQLEQAERRLVQGKYLEGKSYELLAREHGLTPKAIESRLARIRKKLKSLMLRRLKR
jgi:RNA polymerase sigma factor (sigma-70 family)